MTALQKLEYFWTYYKWVFVIVIVAVVLIRFGISWLHDRKIETVLSVAPVNSGLLESGDAELSIRETLGLESEYEEVAVIPTLYANEETGEFDYYSQMNFLTRTQTGKLDILLMPERMAENFSAQEMLLDLTELLGKDNYERFGEQEDPHYLVIRDPGPAELFGLLYEPVCIGVPISATRLDEAKEWIMNGF
ncbi:MAG: hypothetical protein IJX90_10115 [Blautia sp.]|nr:hypothetical protein [Blautia sp.]